MAASIRRRLHLVGRDVEVRLDRHLVRSSTARHAVAVHARVRPGEYAREPGRADRAHAPRQRAYAGQAALGLARGSGAALKRVGRGRLRRARRPRPAPHPGRARPRAQAPQGGRPRRRARRRSTTASSATRISAASPRRATQPSAAQPARRPRKHPAHDRVPIGGSADEPTLLARLRHLRLSGMAEALPARLAQAEGGAPAASRIPRAARRGRAAPPRRSPLRSRRVKQAEIVRSRSSRISTGPSIPRCPSPRSWSSASARFVAEHEDVLLFGPPGLGKSHIATAIAIGAIRAGYRVLAAQRLRPRAGLPRGRGSAPSARTSCSDSAKIDLLVIEDFGMKRLPPSAAEDLLEVFVRRHEKPRPPSSPPTGRRGLGRFPRRRSRGHRHPRSLPLPRPDRPTAGQELPAAPARRACRTGQRGTSLMRLVHQGQRAAPTRRRPQGDPPENTTHHDASGSTQTEPDDLQLVPHNTTCEDQPLPTPSQTGLWMLPDLWTAPTDAPPTRSLEIAPRFPQHPQPKPRLSQRT